MPVFLCEADDHPQMPVFIDRQSLVLEIEACR
jgi:hypothetical protein